MDKPQPKFRPEDAANHTGLADNAHLRLIWSTVANEIFAAKKDESRAIHAANAAVAAERRRNRH